LPAWKGRLNFRQVKTELGCDSRIFRSSIQMFGLPGKWDRCATAAGVTVCPGA
jgi:hypothetical protein